VLKGNQNLSPSALRIPRYKRIYFVFALTARVINFLRLFDPGLSIRTQIYIQIQIESKYLR